jgi:hypothetical protein
MPTVSESQRRWGYAVKGAAWMRRHHMANPGALPERVGKKKKRLKGFLRRKRG